MTFKTFIHFEDPNPQGPGGAISECLFDVRPSDGSEKPWIDGNDLRNGCRLVDTQNFIGPRFYAVAHCPFNPEKPICHQ
jgi:hypothetical protein